jgi:hypothetical protein
MAMIRRLIERVIGRLTVGRGLIGYLLLAVLALALGAEIAFAGESTTTVTTYVVHTQDERQQTRWTLTEWLRIKERTKLMDVWLAMFSDPNKSKFAPELNASILATQSTMQRKVDGALTDSGTGQGRSAKAQVWLTNVLSSRVGIRMLNVDLGFEAGAHDSGILAPKALTDAEAQAATPAAVTSTSAAQTPYARTNWYTFNMRLFGRHIQDTSLILKYGLMQTKNTLQLSSAAANLGVSSKSGSQTASGPTAGAEIQVYLTRNLGLEGTGHQYRATTVAYADHTLTGSYGEGLAFIEIGILRLQGGVYEERWIGKWSDVWTSTLEHGYVGGIKVLL